MLSHVMFQLEQLQGSFANTDLMEAAFDLVNDGVIFLNTNQEITKVNKTAEILFNSSSQSLIGRSISDLLSSN